MIRPESLQPELSIKAEPGVCEDWLEARWKPAENSLEFSELPRLSSGQRAFRERRVFTGDRNGIVRKLLKTNKNAIKLPHKAVYNEILLLCEHNQTSLNLIEKARPLVRLLSQFGSRLCAACRAGRITINSHQKSYKF